MSKQIIPVAVILILAAIIGLVAFKPDLVAFKPGTADKAGQDSARPAQAKDSPVDAKTGADAAASAKLAAPKPLFEGWTAPAVAILLTGEQHGYVEPCGCSLHQLGGYSRRADLIRQIEERGWPVTAFDAGGLVNNPTRRQGKFKFDMMQKCLVDMHYAGVAMGVEEIQLSFDFLSFHRAEELPFLCANLVCLDDVKCPGAPLPGRIVTIGKTKIGVTAVFGPELEEKVRPGGQDPGGFEIKILPPAEAIQKQLAEFEADHPDLLILIAHGRYDDTLKLAAGFPQFDIVVATGGSEDPDPRTKTIGEKTLLIAPGQKGKHVPVVGFYPDNPQARLKYELVEMDENRFHETPRIADHMRYYQQDMLEKENLVANESAIDDPRNVDPLSGAPVDSEANRFVGVKVCAECHTAAYDIWKDTGHARATQTLKTGRGEADYISRIFDPECVACHTTGWDTKKFVRYKTGYTGEFSSEHLLGQQCENCHGPGGRHTELERQFAKDKMETDELKAWRKFQRLSKKDSFDLCAKCHDGDNDPNFKTDSFDRYWNQIAHPGRD